MFSGWWSCDPKHSRSARGYIICMALSHLCVCLSDSSSCTPDHIFPQRLFLSDWKTPKTKGRQRRRLNKIRWVITSHLSLTSCDKENMFCFLFPERTSADFCAVCLNELVSHICACRFVLSRREETVYLLGFPLLFVYIATPRPSGVACVYVNVRGAVGLVCVCVESMSVWLYIDTAVAVVLRGVCVSAC